jgi:ribosomal protein L5
MNFYQKHYEQTILKDLTSKFNYQNTFQTLKLNSITLHTGFNNSLIKNNLVNFILLEFISQNFPSITKSTKNSILFKKKKNEPNGLKVNLHKKQAYKFLQKLTLFILPRLKTKLQNYTLKTPNIFSFSIQEMEHFHELTFFYQYFKNSNYIDVNLKSNLIKNQTNDEFLFLLNSFQLAITS